MTLNGSGAISLLFLWTPCNMVQTAILRDTDLMVLL